MDSGIPSLTVTPSTAGSFNLTWSASDPPTVPEQANPPVQEFEVQVGQAVTATITWQGWLTGTNQTSADYSGKVGYSYYFRVKARDRAGNQNAAWVQAGPYSITRLATKYYLFGSQRVAMRQGGVVYYLHGDHLGSTSLTTDQSGALVSQARYLPYGEERWTTGASPTDFAFTSQRRDGFGLYDYNARYYSQVLGRFISPDTVVPGMPALTIGIADSANSETKAIPSVLNRYAYVSNNPIIGTDPDGHCFPVCTAVIGALIGGAAMGIGYAANQYITGQEINLVETLAAVGTGMAAGALVGSGVGIVAAGATGATLTTAATLTGAGMGMAGAGGGNIVSNIITGNEFDTQNFLVTSAYGGVAGALAPHYGTSVVGAMSINGLANVATSTMLSFCATTLT